MIEKKRDERRGKDVNGNLAEIGGGYERKKNLENKPPPYCSLGGDLRKKEGIKKKKGAKNENRRTTP